MRFLLTLLVCLGSFTAGFSADPPTGKLNRLAKEASPYLRQHAGNPVDWYPWGPEAFAKAKAEGKLIFLSIGYSACHWCHVMERESFAEPAAAEMLNKNFVCIKVDREERPDIDEVYMAAFSVLGISGGWPLSMFLTDDGKPIFGGTYWPKDDKTIDGELSPGFKTVLKRVMDLNAKDHAGLVKQADEVAKRTAAEMEAKPMPLVKLDKTLLADAVAAFEIDPEFGGFGQKLRGWRGTKFPRPASLLFLLRNAGDDKKLMADVTLSLRKMADGGICDQLGGGFHRYSTERTWTVPHFEKMLYDNAQLLELYSDHQRRTNDLQFDATIRGIAEFIERDLTSPEGLFFSALDADTDGKEGLYYVWTKPELDAILGAGAAGERLRAWYGCNGKPNFEKEHFIPVSLKPLLPSEADAKDVLALRDKLIAVRSKRVKPFLDTKVIAGWNGLTIAGLAEAGRSLNEPKYLAAANRAADALLSRMRTPTGELLRIYAALPNEKLSARGPTFADDYAGVIHGLLTLYDVTKDAKRLQQSRELLTILMKNYGDETGGVFLTPSAGEKLFARGKDHYDGTIPSANGLTAKNAARLWRLTGEAEYKTILERSLTLFAGPLQTLPTSAATSAEALGLYLTPPVSRP